jgi:signal transduction histidine kinase
VQWIADDIKEIANPETLESLALLQGRVARMQMLLDGLLSYSRVGHSNSPIEDVDIAEVVNEVAAMLAPPPGFVITCEGAMPVLHTHRMPIQVVLENLISNGLKHHDRAEGRITVSARPVDDATEFRVSDDGPGIAPEFHERIFLIFQTLASRDDVESSGIGLAIVKKKVQTHGGQIWVESAPPARGTTFVFTWKEAAQ